MAETACVIKITSPREYQIYQLMRMGKTRREIIAVTGLSKGSVDYYVDKIRAKLGLKRECERQSPPRSNTPRPKSAGFVEIGRHIPMGLNPRAMSAPARPVITRRDATDPQTPPMLVVRIPYPGGVILDRRERVCPWLSE